MLIAVLLLAILTLGAVSASEDISSDDSALTVYGDALSEDTLAVNDEEADIDESPVLDSASANDGDDSIQSVDDEIILGEDDDEEESNPYYLFVITDERIITDADDEDYDNEAIVAGIILPPDTEDGHLDIFTDDDVEIARLDVGAAGEGPWHIDENGNLKAHVFLNDLDLTNVNDGDNVHFLFFDADGETVDDYSTSRKIEITDSYIRFYVEDGDDDEWDGDDGVIIYVPQGDEEDFNLDDDLDKPFAFVSVIDDMQGIIKIYVYDDEEDEEFIFFEGSLSDLNGEIDEENEGFTVYSICLDDIGENLDALLDWCYFEIGFFQDDDGDLERIDNRRYEIEYFEDENIIRFWEVHDDDDDDDDEIPHGEGEQIEAEFTSANMLINGVVVTIPKENLPEDVDNEFTVTIYSWIDEPIEVSLNLEDILEGNDYVIRVNDLQLPEFELEMSILMVIQFYSDDEKAYYAEYDDDEWPITIFQSPYIFNEVSIYRDQDVINIHEIPEGVDEFTITISKEGSEDIVKTFKFSEMDIDEEEGWVLLNLNDLGITEEGDYLITVKFSDDLIYTGNLNVNSDIEIQTNEEDDEGELHTFTSVDETVAKILISESVSGYVNIYVDDTQVGGNIDFADLPMGKWPTGREILLNDLKIYETGEHTVKLELYIADELLAEKEFDILVEVSESSVNIDEGALPYGVEDIFEFTVGSPISDGQYFNIYFNDVKAGEYTLDNGLVIFDEFTDSVFEVRILKPGNYEVRVTFFDGETETDVGSGSFSINELELFSDKEVYVYGIDPVIISFNMDSVEDDDVLWAYYVFNWDEVQRDDDMIFNPYGGDQLKDDGLYEDGKVSFDVAHFLDNDNYRLDLGETLIYVLYERANGERLGGLIKVNVVEEIPAELIDPELSIAPIDDVYEGVDVTVSVSANENFNGVVNVFVGETQVGTINMENGQGSLTVGAGNFTVGDNVVKVTSEESDVFSEGSAETTVVVKEKIAPELSIASIGDVYVGADVIVSVSANENFNGVVNVFVGETQVGTINMENGQGSLAVGAGNFTVGDNVVKVTSAASDEFSEGSAETTVVVKDKLDPELSISVANIVEGANAVVVITTNSAFSGTVQVQIGDSNYTVDVINGSGSLSVAGLSVGNYTATATFKATDVFSESIKSAAFTVKPAPVATAIKATAVSTTYGTSKNIVITLTDANGNKLVGKNVKVVLNGVSKTLTTNDKGQVTFAVGTKLAPKTYTAAITFAGDENYIKSTGSAKVVVAKAKPKITAKKKTFKVKTKTKKYYIVLKTDKKKALSKVKVTIKVKGKTYKAKTNAKGKATFKITKLTKKGKYKATVKFAGNKYYKAVSKKVLITVKK